MIYHITTHETWQAALKDGVYRNPDLEKEGFIHCSGKDQVLESAEKHFQGFDELVVLQIVEKRVADILKFEPSRGGIFFPHIYGPIPLEAIESQSLLLKNSKNKFDWI